jgi:mRNA deadenylase 3'-5' endonuclease subunit Ccr4
MNSKSSIHDYTFSENILLPPHSSAPKEAVSVLSFNILLPNSVDGWWVYKMYSTRHKDLSSEDFSWESRRKLIQRDIESADCDIVCFQEVSPESFVDDFSFMRELGYDRHELFKKGRFRPATFWRSSRIILISEPIHRDRILITPFLRRDYLSDSESSNNHISSNISRSQLESSYWIANCHLRAAGSAAPARRFRQIYDCVDTIRKEISKLMPSAPMKPVKVSY